MESWISIAGGSGIRWSLKASSNLNHSVIAQPCSAICAQYHSWPFYFRIILILKTFPWPFSISFSSFLYETPDLANVLPLPGHQRCPLPFSPYWINYWGNNQKNQSISFSSVISPVLFMWFQHTLSFIFYI